MLQFRSQLSNLKEMQHSLTEYLRNLAIGTHLIVSDGDGDECEVMIGLSVYDSLIASCVSHHILEHVLIP